MPTLAKLAYLLGGRKTPITILEQSGRDLIDYQIKVSLTSAWDGWGRVKPDASDIYFLDDLGNPLYFWIEDWDYANKSATIWVKVPKIPASSKITIYMYYAGVNPFISYRNPAKVFDFWRDFEDGSTGGLIVTAGIFQAVEETDPLDPSSIYVLQNRDTSAGGRRGYWVAGVTGSFVLEVYWRRPGTGNGAISVAIKSGDNGYRFSQEDTTLNNIRIMLISSWSGGTLTALASTPRAPDTDWHKVSVIYDNGYMKFCEDSTCVEATDTTYAPPFDIGVWCGPDYYTWDDFRVRKYVSPEPLVSLQASISAVKDMDLM